jgi:hypothetical protein
MSTWKNGKKGKKGKRKKKENKEIINGLKKIMI